MMYTVPVLSTLQKLKHVMHTVGVHTDKFVSIIICTHQQHGKKALCHEMDL